MSLTGFNRARRLNRDKRKAELEKLTVTKLKEAIKTAEIETDAEKKADLIAAIIEAEGLNKGV